VKSWRLHDLKGPLPARPIRDRAAPHRGSPEPLFRPPPKRCWYPQRFKLRAHTVAAALARWSEHVLALVGGVKARL
jgi:hypothetical protein